jgi:hypothetical protein
MPNALTLAATNKSSIPNAKRGDTFPPIGKTGENWTNQVKTLITLDWLEIKIDAGNLRLEIFNSKGTYTFGKGSELFKLELLPFGGKTYRTGAAIYYVSRADLEHALAAQRARVAAQAQVHLVHKVHEQRLQAAARQRKLLAHVRQRRRPRPCTRNTS